jgi:hypothetical protein
MEQENLERLEVELDDRIALLKKSISDSTELLDNLVKIKSNMRRARRRCPIKLHDFSLPSGTLWSGQIVTHDCTLSFNYGDALKLANELNLELPSYSDFAELIEYTNVDVASLDLMLCIKESGYYKIGITSMVTATEHIEIHSGQYIIKQFSDNPNPSIFRFVKFNKDIKGFEQIYGDVNTKARLLLVSHK